MSEGKYSELKLSFFEIDDVSDRMKLPRGDAAY